MRIEKLILKNYRQYKDMEISFNKGENDLFIFLGHNSSGKTNLLNAVNWCLYNEEPHSSMDTKKLPITNLSALKENKDTIEVLVEIWLDIENNNYIKFKRKDIYKIYGEGEEPVKQSTSFKVILSDKFGNIEILNDEDAQYEILERVLPSALREFYFFDGERLDVYFKDYKSQNIKHEVMMLSNICMLKEMHRRIITILRDLKRKAGRLNPDLDRIRREQEEKDNSLNEIDKDIENTKNQIKIARKRIKEYDQKLRDIPDIESLKIERDRLKKEKTKKEKDLLDKYEKRRILLLKYTKIIGIGPAIEESIKLIDQKKVNKEIPPTIDKGLLEKTIHDSNCNVCGRPLDEHSEERVKQLIEEVQLSSEMVYELISMENPLKKYKDEISEFTDKINDIKSDINLFEKEIDDLGTQISNIGEKMVGYDIEKIEVWYRDLNNFEESLEKNSEKLGSLKAERKQILEEIENLKDEFKKHSEYLKKAKKLLKRIKFCENASKITEESEKSIMIETRNNIEKETKNLFFKLIWDKDKYKDVKIDEDYEINVIHPQGYICTGSLSAAESELLAFSFTLALHKVSGFESPIIIDTPVAKVSGGHRKNIGEIFLEVSKTKQIILLFTDKEYSDELQNVLENKILNKYNLIFRDKKETILEVLK